MKPRLSPRAANADSPGAHLKILFASLGNTRSIPIRVRRYHAVRFPSKVRNHVTQGSVDPRQEKQGKAGEQSGTDAVPPEPKGYGSRKYRDR